MPAREQVIRAAATLPLAIVRRLPAGRAVADRVERLLPADERAPAREERVESAVEAGTPDVDARTAAAGALERDRELVEEPAPPDADLGGHIESEVELVGESSDVEAVDPPGPQLHVDEPWEGYRRMKVAEIAARLDGQPSEVVAAVELYETAHRRRRGVLDAVKAASRGQAR